MKILVSTELKRKKGNFYKNKPPFHPTMTNHVCTYIFILSGQILIHQSLHLDRSFHLSPCRGIFINCLNPYLSKYWTTDLSMLTVCFGNYCSWHCLFNFQFKGLTMLNLPLTFLEEMSVRWWFCLISSNLLLEMTDNTAIFCTSAIFSQNVYYLRWLMSVEYVSSLRSHILTVSLSKFLCPILIICTATLIFWNWK